MTYSQTTIEVQGQKESVYEVYSDKSKEQTIAYVLEEKTALKILHSLALLKALKVCESLLAELEDGGATNPELKIARDAISMAEGL